MKRLALISVLSLLSVGGAGASSPFSRDFSVEAAEIRRIHTEFLAVDERRIRIVGESMRLDPETKTEFELAYRGYVRELSRIRSAQLEGLRAYATAFNSGFELAENALPSVRSSIELESDRLEARRRLLEEVSTLLAPRQLYILAQTEAKFEAETALGIFRQLPTPDEVARERAGRDPGLPGKMKSWGNG